MDSKNLLQKYYSRIKLQGMIKSLLWALVVGFSALLLTSTIWWFAGLKHVWICALIFVVATAASAPIFYFRFYRPTTKKTAQRVDSLGLEERLLTMTQFEHDTSYIAERQREDAKLALSKVNEKLIKLAVSIALIVTLSITGVFGAGMVTVATLSEMGIIGSGMETIIPPEPPKNFDLVYSFEGQGEIIGEAEQVVVEGEDGTAVLAVAADNWVFAGWSDGYASPYRIDKNITTHMEYFAIFEIMHDYVDEDEANANPDEEVLQDPPPDVENQPQGPMEDSTGNSGGSQFEPSNQVIDGGTPYNQGATFENAYETIMDNLTGSNDVSTDGKGMVEDYLSAINNK